jgi:hypothetical protein
VISLSGSRNKVQTTDQYLNWLLPRIDVRMEDPSPLVQATERPPMRLQIVICSRLTR